MEGKSIDELNEFLKGEYMAIDSYETYIQKANNPHVKGELQRIQQEHKHHATQLSERIQNLGGRPISHVDLKGKIAGTVFNLKNLGEQSDSDIIYAAYKGEDMGIRAAGEKVRNDLDTESMNLVDSIMSQDKTHLDSLRNLSSKI